MTIHDRRNGLMNDLSHRDVLMYVRSEDTIRMVLAPDAQDEVLRAYRAKGYCLPPMASLRGLSIGPGHEAGYFGGKPIRDKEIPEAEEQAIQRASLAVHRRGKTLYIVDVGKESALRRVIQEHLHHLHAFPVLVRTDGRRLEGSGNFSDENLERFLSD
jgi:hypothetical protein